MATSQTVSSKKASSAAQGATAGKASTTRNVSATPVTDPLVKKSPVTTVQKVSKSAAVQAAPAAAKIARTTKVVAKKAPAKIGTHPSLTPEERYKLIQAAAYLRAEGRGFASGHALEDWIAAETEIDCLQT